MPAPTHGSKGRLRRRRLLAKSSQAIGKSEVARAVAGMGIVRQRIVIVLHEIAADLPVEIAQRGEAIHPRPMIAREIEAKRVDRPVVVVDGVARVDEEVGLEGEHRRIDRKSVRPVAVFILLAAHHGERHGGTFIGRGRRHKAAGGGAADRDVGRGAGVDGDFVARARTQRGQGESCGEIVRGLGPAPGGRGPVGRARGPIAHACLSRGADRGAADRSEIDAGRKGDRGKSVRISRVVLEREFFARRAIGDPDDR